MNQLCSFVREKFAVGLEQKNISNEKTFPAQIKLVT